MQGGQAARWSAGTWTPLGAPPAGYSGQPSAIDAAGEVAGVATDWQDGVMIAGRWTRKGVFQQLAGPSEQGDLFVGGMNDYGTIVLDIDGAASTWKQGVITPVAPPEGMQSVLVGAINDKSKLAGTAFDAAGAAHLVRRTLKGWTIIGSLGGPGIGARSMNEAGDIVGDGQVADGNSHAFVSVGAGLRDLNPPGARSSFAEGINTAGVIVGSQEPEYTLSATVWIQYEPYALASLVQDMTGWYLLEAANAINDAGQIVGIGYKNGDMQPHGFLLTPVASN